MASLLRSGVDKEAANLLTIESALSDVLCIITVTTLIEVFTGREAFQAHTTSFVLLRSFGIGIVLGAAAGGLWWFLLDRLRQHEQAYPITLSALLLLYVLVESVGGSAALAVLAFALMVGNAEHLGRYINISARLELNNDLRGFHSQMVFIVKSFFFTFIGAMLGPPWELVAVGALLGAMLLLLRFPGAWLALAGSSMRAGLRRLVYIGVPRGVAAGVLATLPFYAGIPATADLPVIVFACVFATILIFSVAFPLVRRADANVPAEPV
jgi:cell volume regulation protein A